MAAKAYAKRVNFEAKALDDNFVEMTRLLTTQLMITYDAVVGTQDIARPCYLQ